MRINLLQITIDACLDELAIARGAFIVDPQAKPKEFDAITERFWKAYERLELQNGSQARNLADFREHLLQEATAFADLFDRAP